MKLPKVSERIIWLDCFGGLSVGFITLLISKLIATWENLPIMVVLGMGIANLIYGSYSLLVFTRKPRPFWMIELLAIANMIWLLTCTAIIITFWNQISILGVFHLIFEGIYVFTIGVVEWNWRKSLSG